MNKRVSQAVTEKDTRVYYYWLLFALFLEYARPATFIPIFRIPLFNSLVPLVLFAVSFFAKGFRPMSEVVKDPIAKWMFIYVALVMLSVSYAIIGEFAFNQVKLAFGFCTLGLLIARIATTEERIFGVVGSLTVAHLFLLAMNPQVLSNPETRNYIEGSPFLGDGNDFSLSLCILIPCLIEVGISAKVFWRKAAAFGSILLLIFAIIATQSRGATLGIGAVLFYLWLKSPRKAVSLAVISVAILAALLYAPSNYFSRMATIADYQNEASAMSRIDIWKAGTRMALDNPVLGVGAGNFPVAYGTTYKAPGEYAWKNSHSAYFQVWGELGTVGLITLFMIIFGNFIRNARLRAAILASTQVDPDIARVHARRLYLFSAAMLGFVVAGAFLSAAYYPHLFVITGIFLAVRHVAEVSTGVQLVTGPSTSRRHRAEKSVKRQSSPSAHKAGSS
jgi:putative inorganic carbon (HCO3(-)) transporter